MVTKDYIYIAIIGFVFFFLKGCEQVENLLTVDKEKGIVIKQSVIENVTKDIKEKADSLQKIIYIKQSEPAKVVIQHDTIVVVDVKYVAKKNEVVKDSRKYLDTIRLKNGTIFSEIIADSLHYTSYKLETKDTIITKSIYKEKIIAEKFFLHGMNVVLNPNNNKSIQLTSSYIHKNRFSFTAGLNYNVTTLPNDNLGLILGASFRF